MNGSRYSKIALVGGVHIIRQRGSQKNKTTKKPRWIDRIKENCGTLGMTAVSKTAQDGNNWRTAENGPSMHA